MSCGLNTLEKVTVTRFPKVRGVVENRSRPLCNRGSRSAYRMTPAGKRTTDHTPVFLVSLQSKQGSHSSRLIEARKIIFVLGLLLVMGRVSSKALFSFTQCCARDTG